MSIIIISSDTIIQYLLKNVLETVKKIEIVDSFCILKELILILSEGLKSTSIIKMATISL